MQAQEMVRKAGFFRKAYALALVVVPESQEQFLRECRHMKEALLDWHRRRGRHCETVMFTVVSDPALHPGIRSALVRIYSDEAEMGPVLKAMNTRVSLLDKAGRPVEEFALGQA